MKTYATLTAILMFTVTGIFSQGMRENDPEGTNATNRLRPVFFNFHLRKLYYSSFERVSGAAFLRLCRTINDSAVQYQVSRYDAFTKKKAAILAAMGVNGLAGVLLINSGSELSYSPGSSDLSPALITVGVLAIISVPVLAITTSIPHQRRKEVLFKDLPVAYNHYVEQLNNSVK